MSKNLFIFGAGASYGSDIGKVPALGTALFDELVMIDPNGWGQLEKIDKEIVQSFKEDFEAGMVLLSNKYPHSLAPLQRAMAFYFFNFYPSNQNLYFKISEKIKNRQWDGVFATLNYERLLEISILASGLKPVIGKKAEQGEVEICLPHGCCHIFCESARGSAQGVTFAGMNVSIDGELKVISNPVEFNSRITTDAFPPVMSYFEPEKRTTAGNSLILSQRSRLNEIINNAENIAIIGIRVREHDKHIWESLAKTKARIIYCSGVSASVEYEMWAEKNGRTGDEILREYFRNSFDTICNKMGLS